jgi:hypothetical protein
LGDAQKSKGRRKIVKLLSHFKKVLFSVACVGIVLGSSVAQAKHDDDDVNPVVTINLPARRLTLRKDGMFVKAYSIAVSALGFVAPLGKREITRIVWNPWWYPPKNREWAKDEVDMPPGPKNPMGPVKMDIGARYYIHGTNEEWTVGRPVTHGCVRLKNADAKEMAAWLQLNYSTHFKAETFDRNLNAGKENIIVTLDKPVPVQVIYDTVEIRDDVLYVYTDIYVHKEARLALIQKELERDGYDLSKLRLRTLKWFLTKAGDRDLQIRLSEILTSTKREPAIDPKDISAAKKSH